MCSLCCTSSIWGWLGLRDVFQHRAPAAIPPSLQSWSRCFGSLYPIWSLSLPPRRRLSLGQRLHLPDAPSWCCSVCRVSTVLVKTTSLQAPTALLTIPVTLALHHCADVVPPCSSGGGPSMGLSCSLPSGDNKEALMCFCSSAGMGSPGTALAAFPGSSLLHKQLSERAASLTDSLSSPWSFVPVGPVVAAGDLYSPFFPGPFKDLAHKSPRD